jgi:hypothetical protein
VEVSISFRFLVVVYSFDYFHFITNRKQKQEIRRTKRVSFVLFRVRSCETPLRSKIGPEIRPGTYPSEIVEKRSRDVLEVRKQRLVGDRKREVNNRDVKNMSSETEQLKELVAELTLKNRILTPVRPGKCRMTVAAGGAGEKGVLAKGANGTNDP